MKETGTSEQIPQPSDESHWKTFSATSAHGVGKGSRPMTGLEQLALAIFPIGALYCT